MTWNNESLAIRERIANLSREEKRQICEVLLAPDDVVGARGSIQVLEVPTPDGIAAMLAKASPECLEMLRRALGSSCKGACATTSTAASKCYGRRLSVLEEASLRADKGGVLDIPTVAGAGGTVTLTVPAYNAEYWLEQFSMDGDIAVATGSLSKVEVKITHAGFPLATFRVSQWYKASCCTTIADAFKEHGICLGWGSTFQLTITNTNALVGESFINGVFSYIRFYPNAG